MDKINLGNTGINVSRLGLGTVKFGRNKGVKYPKGFELPSDKECAALLELSQELGINMLDTAPAYGTSEERLGKVLTGQRDRWVIVGKAGEEFENGASSYHFTPEHFQMSLERSLRRLNTDYLDILLIHSDGSDLDILSNEALIETMIGFKERGLVKAIGASTKTADGGIKCLELMDVVMAMYTPDYQDEKPVLDYAAKHNKGLLLKKVFSSGHAQDIQSAMAFALSHPSNPCTIIGTINPKHLKENIDAANKALG